MSESSGSSAGRFTVCLGAAAAEARTGEGLLEAMLWEQVQEWGVCGQRQLLWAGGEGPGLQNGVAAQRWHER